jgi:hypothetical protein
MRQGSFVPMADYRPKLLGQSRLAHGSQLLHARVFVLTFAAQRLNQRGGAVLRLGECLKGSSLSATSRAISKGQSSSISQACAV